MAFVMVWLRLSTARLLPWYKNSSYQSKDIAHIQKTIAQRMADKACALPLSGSMHHHACAMLAAPPSDAERAWSCLTSMVQCITCRHLWPHGQPASFHVIPLACCAHCSPGGWAFSKPRWICHSCVWPCTDSATLAMNKPIKV